MNVLDLFSGIGGFSLGLERAGMRTVAFCEIDPFCQRVLARHWPTVPCYPDIRTLDAVRLAANAATGDVRIDVICGGFPCQDISHAGKGAGIEGERSGLWTEYARIIGEVRPRFVIVENVAALLGRGLDRVLGDLAALGFDAEWHCIPASAVGAPHGRDRLWIIAHTNSEGHQRPRYELPRGWSFITGDSVSLIRDWEATPRICRADDGLSYWPQRIKALGNAVVPQIPEIIGRAIMRATP